MKKNNEKVIYVFEEWSSITPVLMGTLFVEYLRGEETYSFSYEPNWLKNNEEISLDPNLFPYEGRRYILEEKRQFGIFLDSSPDRWGRTLLKRKENLTASKENRKVKTLTEVDYLLGVDDETRMGAIRFKLDPSGPFLAQSSFSVPPLVKLRELEDASHRYEGEGESDERLVSMLLSPGSSLGGARPKANVKDPKGNLWIAKFPSRHDEYDIGAWEYVAHELSKMCGINAPEAKLMKFSPRGSTFLNKRFDRIKDRRIHFASAMTLLGKNGGESIESSYLDLLEFIMENSCRPKEDAKELFKRLVFNIAVKNTDDHLRNHGFILDEKGWRLSPCYDVNPNPEGTHLSLNISETENDLNMELALESAPCYGLKKDQAKEIVETILKTVKANYASLARNIGISDSSIKAMSKAFEE